MFARAGVRLLRAAGPRRVCALPLQAALLSLPARCTLPALQPRNAAYVLEAVACAVATLQPGAHASPMLAVLGPFVARLQRLAADPAGAVAAAAADGSLLAVLTHTDGTIKAPQLAALGTDEASAEAMVAEGLARRGAIARIPPSLRLEKVGNSPWGAQRRRAESSHIQLPLPPFFPDLRCARGGALGLRRAVFVLPARRPSRRGGGRVARWRQQY